MARRDASYLFQGIEAAVPLARRLAEERGVTVMGVYCAARERDLWDIAFRLPPAFADGYLLIATCHGWLLETDCLRRNAPPHGWLPCPWRLRRERISQATLNPRRMHTSWLRLFGPIGYGHCPVPEPTDPAQLQPAAASEGDWFSAEHHAVEVSALPHDDALLRLRGASPSRRRCYTGRARLRVSGTLCRNATTHVPSSRLRNAR